MLCVFCKHFRWDPGSPGYSEMTPSSPMVLACGKRHWEITPYETTAAEFRQFLLRASTCPDYVLSEDTDPLGAMTAEQQALRRWGKR